jgi:hypothetical protein
MCGAIPLSPMCLVKNRQLHLYIPNYVALHPKKHVIFPEIKAIIARAETSLCFQMSPWKEEKEFKSGEYEGQNSEASCLKPIQHPGSILDTHRHTS